MQYKPKGPITIASPMDRSQIDDHVILKHSDSIVLSEQILNHLSKGYCLFGFTYSFSNLHCQAMIKYAEKKKKTNNTPEIKYKNAGKLNKF